MNNTIYELYKHGREAKLNKWMDEYINAKYTNTWKKYTSNNNITNFVTNGVRRVLLLREDQKITKNW